MKNYQTMSSFYSKRESTLTKRGIIFSVKMRNSGIYIYIRLWSVVLRKGFLIKATMLVVDHTNNTISIFWRQIENDPLLRVSDTNKVPISSHIWVASTTFKRLWDIMSTDKMLADKMLTDKMPIRQFVDRQNVEKKKMVGGFAPQELHP